MKTSKKNSFMKNAFGFTLAEVLITLGIIGVVAALTIPILMNNIQDNQFKVAYKKAFSVASQAWQSTVADNMLEPRDGWVSDISNYNNFKQFMTKFSIVKTCDKNSLSQCWAPNEATDVLYNIPFNYTGDDYELCFIDKSGIAWCNVRWWGYMIVDTNGQKTPNQYGIDRFVFYETINNTKGDASGTGIPNSISPLWKDFTSYDQYYCPSAAKHPCYYIKWLYN